MDIKVSDEKIFPHAIYKIIIRGYDSDRNCAYTLVKLGISEFERVADRVGHFIPYGPDGINIMKYKNLEWETQFEMLFKVPTWFIADAIEKEVLERSFKYIHKFKDEEMGIQRRKRGNNVLQRPTGYSEYREIEASPIILQTMFEIMLKRTDVEILNADQYNQHVIKCRESYKYKQNVTFDDL